MSFFRPFDNYGLDFIWNAGVILAIVGLAILLGGCAGKDHNPTVTTGLGVLHEPRGDTNTKDVLRMTALVHCEDRPAEGAVQEFIKTFSNITGWPQAIASAATAPVGLGSEVVGMDRSEGVVTLELDNPKQEHVPDIISAWYQAVHQFQMNQKACFVNTGAGTTGADAQ